MRVIAGKARRIQLKTISGNDTRPTTDRIKETLFNILQPDLYDSTFLDLFSGSGAIGIEALSRGAAEAVFVENNKEAVKCIEENLKNTRLNDYAVIKPLDVITAIRRLNGREAFSFVFMDPPYKAGVEKSVLDELALTSLVDENTVIIIEASLDNDFSFAEDLGFEITREKCYKTNKHVFLRYTQGEK